MKWSYMMGDAVKITFEVLSDEYVNALGWVGGIDPKKALKDIVETEFGASLAAKQSMVRISFDDIENLKSFKNNLMEVLDDGDVDL